MRRIFANLIVFLLLSMTHAQAADVQLVRMATTTSTENSGLFTVIQPVFARQLGIKVHVIAVGTGKALELGRPAEYPRSHRRAW